MSANIATRSQNKHRPLRRLFRRRRLIRLVKEADLNGLTFEEAAHEALAFTPAAAYRLHRRIRRIGEALHRRGVLSASRWEELEEWLSSADPDAAAEKLSPYHAPLLTKDLYRQSDGATRQLLRRSLARYARRHRLPPESALLLWNGERTPCRRLPLLLLLLPLCLALLVTVWGTFYLPLVPALLLWLTLPASVTAGVLAVAAVLQKAVPKNPLPMLKSGKGHPLLTVCVGRMDEADRALEGAARIAVSAEDGQLLLVLIRRDSLLLEEAGEQEEIASLRERVRTLLPHSDTSTSLIVPPRRFDPARKRWIGSPTPAQLAELISSAVGQCTPVPEAICILPADGAPLPACTERLAAALFHPLCKQDALVFLTPADSPLPDARLAILRQCLLQKFEFCADLTGWGIYRKEALSALAQGKSLSVRLSAEPLGSSHKSVQSHQPAPIRRVRSFLPLWRWLLPALRAILLLAVAITRIPLRYALLLLCFGSADLWSAALLSIRTDRKFVLYTLPAWKRIAGEFVGRTFLPVRALCRLSAHTHMHKLPCIALLSLLYGGAAIAAGGRLAYWGLFWCIAPILLAQRPIPSAPSPSEKAACHALAKELYPLLCLPEDGLPPAYLTVDRERAVYTTPAVLGYCLAAELAACDLGIIDPYTLERRVSALLSRLERLPTRGGLPFSRYDTQTDHCTNERIDTLSCAIYALCLAVVEIGLKEHSHRCEGLLPLADRAAHLSMQIDFSALMNDDLTLCRSLSPSGEKEGTLRHLFGGGAVAAFATLASDSTQALSGGEKRRVWRSLAAPVRIRKGRCLILSEEGTVDSYLLPLLLLPAPSHSLIPFAAQKAVRAAKGRRPKPELSLGKRIGKLLHVIGFLQKRERPTAASRQGQSCGRIRIGSLVNWPHLSNAPRPLRNALDRIGQDGHASCEQAGASTLCLLLPLAPRYALSLLCSLQKTESTGGFTDPTHPERIPMDRLAMSLIALGGTATGRKFAHRTLAHPRYGALYPFLCTEPQDAGTKPSPFRKAAALEATALRPPSVCLLGNAASGLLIAHGRGLSLWANGTPLTAPAPVNALFAQGRLSGLLLEREGKLLPAPTKVKRRDANGLTLEGDGIACRIDRSACGWSLTWSVSSDAPLNARFLFCPTAAGAVRLSEVRTDTAEDGSAICLCVEYSPTLTLAILASGLTEPFTHADPSPFPRGSGQATAVFALPPRPAEGLMQAPSCMIGGRIESGTLSVRLAVGVGKEAALNGLSAPYTASLPEKDALPLPIPDGSTASRVLNWQLTALFEGAPVPAAMVVSRTGDRDYLTKCLEGGKELLDKRGFPVCEKAPLPLSVSRHEGADALIDRLSALAPPEGETPLLPARSQISYPDGHPHILRGRDRPHLCRIFTNGIATLYADPEALRFVPHRDAKPLELTFYLHCGEQTLFLPAAATAVTYLPEEAVLEGKDFTLRLTLLPKLPLLAIRLLSPFSATPQLAPLSPPHKTEGDTSLWFLSDDRVLFCRRLASDDETVWLVGSFPRAQDRLYYWIGETLVPPAIRETVKAEGKRLRAAASLLTDASGTPALAAHAARVLSDPSPARALLAPLCTPEDAKADLIRLAKAPPSLLLPMALAIYTAVTDDLSASQLRIPVGEGKATLYLLAVRYLERAMEEDGDHPLLTPLASAFSRLAYRTGDQTGIDRCAAFVSEPRHAPRSWDSLPEASPETVELLAALQTGEADAPERLQTALTRLPDDRDAADTALLWSGMLWGVLGFIPSKDGFTLAPLPVKRETTIFIGYKGKWRVTLRPGDAPICTHADASLEKDAPRIEKIFRNRKISRQNGCIVHKNGVK